MEPPPALLSLNLNDLNARQHLLSPGFDTSSGLLSPVTVIEWRRGSTSSEAQTCGRMSPLEPWITPEDENNPAVVLVCNAQSQTSPPLSITCDAGIQTEKNGASLALPSSYSLSPSSSSSSSSSTSVSSLTVPPSGEELFLFLQNATQSLLQLYQRTEELLFSTRNQNDSLRNPLQELDSILSERSAVTASLRDTQSGVMAAMRRLDDRFRSFTASAETSEEHPTPEVALRQRLTALEAELRASRIASTSEGASLSDSSQNLKNLNEEILQNLSQLPRRAFSEGAMSDVDLTSDSVNLHDVALQTEETWKEIDMEEVMKEIEDFTQDLAEKKDCCLTPLSDDPHKKVAIWLSDVAFCSESPDTSFLDVGAKIFPPVTQKSPSYFQSLQYLGNSTVASAGSFDEEQK